MSTNPCAYFNVVLKKIVVINSISFLKKMFKIGRGSQQTSSTDYTKRMVEIKVRSS
jgi:hypothetical protein